MNGFKDDEVVSVEGKRFPIVGGRLRLAHEGNGHLSIKTDLLAYQLDDHAIVRCTVTTDRGEFMGTGVATVSRDPKLVDALLELAETRSIARALRFAGYGVEMAGIEEVTDQEIIQPQQPQARQPLRVINGQRNGNGGGNGHSTPANGNGIGVHPSNGNGGGNGGNGHQAISRTVATSAQLRAIRSLARQAGTSAEKACQQMYQHGRVEELSIREASSLIDQMKNQSSPPAA